jgi:hypothetical protein
MPRFVDLWRWFDGFGAEARRSRDPARIKLHGEFRRGWEYLRKEPSFAANIFLAGAALARQLGYPCWELFYEYWACEAYAFYQRDMNLARQQAVKAFVLAQQPHYSTCAVVGRVYRMFVDVYSVTDNLGYLDEIAAMNTYMEENVPMDEDTYHLVKWRQSGIYYDLDQWEEARVQTLKYINLVRGHAYRETDGYQMLHRIACHQRDYPTGYGYIVQSEDAARISGREQDVAYAQVAQAVYKRREGDHYAAAALVGLGCRFYEESSLTPDNWYYDSLCEYYELCDNAAQALAERDAQLRLMEKLGGQAALMDCRLKRARLKGRLGLPPDDELAAARALATEFRKPERHLAKLDKVAAGEFADE